ncbi:ribosomal protein S18-alanine N-acetyltransferase [Staphylococcus felis]|uniref:[Ribosomal protein bS18]-alanine N-acetyltransferase n=1 Tax=Staphylococcus felis TaxID=46127 RepID=A0A3E0ILB9_9STAP|nr:ribosomal protein S18-alanine N-acetyltransferase [Staphylococcus felis]REH89792.1 ribosomal-protein-alanine N-acetyltransferase [Staphylococcus felis]
MSVEAVPAVTDIERVSYMERSWTIDAFYHDILENNFAHYFIMEYENKVIGYCGIWIVVDQAQITTIAIEPNYRVLGLGQLMLKYVMNFASAVATLMSLEVRVENRTAQHVYEKLGFEYGGRRKNYYGDGEDALVMWVNLNE